MGIIAGVAAGATVRTVGAIATYFIVLKKTRDKAKAKAAAEQLSLHIISTCP